MIMSYSVLGLTMKRFFPQGRTAPENSFDIVWAADLLNPF